MTIETGRASIRIQVGDKLKTVVSTDDDLKIEIYFVETAQKLQDGTTIDMYDTLITIDGEPTVVVRRDQNHTIKILEGVK